MWKLRPFRGFVVPVLALSLPLGAQNSPPAPSPPQAAPRTETWSVTANPDRLVNGAPVLFEVKPPSPITELAGKWLGHAVVFSSLPNGRWFALAGVSLETKPGAYPLDLTGRIGHAPSVTTTQQFEVAAADYPSVKLTVSKKFTEPRPEQLATIKRDQEIKGKAFATASPDREWIGRFDAPVEAPISDVFGTRRVFNGVTKSVHQGLDFRVGPGTPVAAVNSGTVILARPLYFEGNCVVIDHGQSLLTLYLHLSEFKVKEGEAVKRGQIVGLSGASGRATGPHLHIAVRWQGTYLDPAVLLRLPVPAS
jgi:murein DD-endopeptidase MepM/ murein hydrolase activator NlpD